VDFERFHTQCRRELLFQTETKHNHTSQTRWTGLGFNPVPYNTAFLPLTKTTVSLQPEVQAQGIFGLGPSSRVKGEGHKIVPPGLAHPFLSLMPNGRSKANDPEDTRSKPDYRRGRTMVQNTVPNLPQNCPGVYSRSSGTRHYQTDHACRGELSEKSGREGGKSTLWGGPE